MKCKFFITACLLGALAFAIPIEHRYDKLFRFFSLTLIPQGLEIFSGYETKIYFYLSDIAALILLFFGFKTKTFFKNPLWIVLLCALFSIIVSPFANYPVCYTRLFLLLTPIVLFSTLATSDEKEKLTKIIFVALFAASLFQTAIAIGQYVQQAPLGLRFFGETITPNYFAMNGKSVMRASGTFTHPNSFGGFMLLAIMATYALIARSPIKWPFFVILPFQLLALSLSFSRSALFGLVIASILWIALLYKSQKKALAPLALLIIFSLGSISTLLFKELKDRGGILNYNATSKSSDSVRLYHQKKALQIIQDRPLFGLGYTQFSQRAAPYFKDTSDSYLQATAPHNIYLFLACETGLLSLIAFLAWISSLIYRGLKSEKTIELATSLSLFIAFIFIGGCDFYPILFHEGLLMFFLTSALLAMHLKPTPQLIKRAS